MLAILIEGRLPIVSPSTRRFFSFVHHVRFAAVSGGTTSTFLCLYVFGVQAPNPGTDVIVSITAVALFFTLVFMTGTILERQRSEAFVRFPGEEEAAKGR
ncbi:hypothetical protein [Arthrobacter sp. B3I4]|uniref:hypothetical protein n=1 Tax=Arthrobacter sp. B3I4 TaxID=3042267 RepID=UPI002787A513|nr:hypothetical protein [Arthrobacter sp. B3I4]MDQ0756093.1 hypothetical protein [Arthrobacter sp. B3I4]